MGVKRGEERATTAIAGLFLWLALSLAGCASSDGIAPPGQPPAQNPAESSTSSTPAPEGPVPTPLPAPPPSVNTPPPVNAPSPAPLPDTAAPLPDTAAPLPDTANQGSQIPAAGETSTASPSGPAAYFVAIGDGGSRGVRFGCDDSLVAVHFTAPAGTDPLAAAMGRLLSPDGTAAGAGLYNALSGSALRYVSGYLDGSTAVVNLTGSLRPGGVCDNPRIETQLAQTAVAATGASRAEIYIDGRDLADILSLR